MHYCYIAGVFSRYSAPIHWLVHGHVTSNSETVSCQMPWAGNIAKTMTSNGKQFTVTREMLTAVARDRWNLSAVFKFCFCFFLGNSEFRLGKQNSLFPRDQSLSVYCLALFWKSRWQIRVSNRKDDWKYSFIMIVLMWFNVYYSERINQLFFNQSREKAKTITRTLFSPRWRRLHVLHRLLIGSLLYLLLLWLIKCDQFDC